MQILLPFATKSPARFNELLAGLRRVYLVAYGVSGRELDGALLDRVEGILGLEEPEAPSPGRSQPSGRLGEKGGGGFLEVGAVVGMDNGSEGFRRVPNGSPLRDGQHRIR